MFKIALLGCNFITQNRFYIVLYHSRPLFDTNIMLRICRIVVQYDVGSWNDLFQDNNEKTLFENMRI